MKFEVQKATLNDADFIASSMIASSRSSSKKGFFDLLFGDVGEEKLLLLVKNLAVSEKKLYTYYENFVIALSGKERVGLLCGYESKLSVGERLLDVLKDMECSENYENVISVYHTCAGDMGRNRWILDFLVVHDGLDEFEISNALLNKSLLSARLKGYREARSIIELEATETQLMYKNLAFSKMSENRNEYYEEMFHSLGLVVMELHL